MRGSKPKRVWFPALAVVLLAATVQGAVDFKSPDTLIATLDDRYYYPQRQGLNRLIVNVEWEQLDTVTGSGRYLKNPRAQFTWERFDAGVRRAMELDESSLEVSSQRKREVLAILEHYKELIVPRTLAEKVSNYQSSLKKVRDNSVLMHFRAPSPGDAIQQYEMLVDLDRLAIPKLRLTQRNAPEKVQSRLSYTDKGGKWLIAESRAHFTMGELEYTETSVFTYRQVKNFWLVRKLVQTVKQEERTLQSLVFRFVDYRIN